MQRGCIWAIIGPSLLDPQSILVSAKCFQTVQCPKKRLELHSTNNELPEKEEEDVTSEKKLLRVKYVVTIGSSILSHDETVFGKHTGNTS